ncbi:hypothetical protein PG997_000554 [Apiospora hydei]|uniref:Uncharacterized protein n=1 Tax=Apiospora hydei TaxID=1337664 RepID=A0ABR1XB66_9PEZI
MDYRSDGPREGSNGALLRELRLIDTVDLNKVCKWEGHDWHRKRWRKIRKGLPKQEPVGRYIWYLTASYAFFSPLIWYAAECEPKVRAWDAYTTDWSIPPEVWAAYNHQKKRSQPSMPPPPHHEMQEKVARWGYPALYAAGLLTYPLCLIPGMPSWIQGRGWREFEAYLAKDVPPHLRGYFLEADHRFGKLRCMYVTGLVRMLPLFGVVWVTKRIVADREREAVGNTGYESLGLRTE